MKTVQIKEHSNFKYTLLEHPDDVTTLPLSRNLFGLNGRIYANLASLPMTDEDKEKLRKSYTDEELRYPLINRLFEVHIHTGTDDDEYNTIEKIDFQELYDFVKENHDKFDTIHASFNDSGNKMDEELGILYIPIGADVLMNAANYAYQEFERLKMDNFMNNFSDSEHLNNFLNIF